MNRLLFDMITMVVVFGSLNSWHRFQSLPDLTGNLFCGGQTEQSLSKFPQIESSHNTDSLMLVLSQSVGVYASAFGYDQTYVEEFACFDRLRQLLKEEDWLKLVNHPSPQLRLYAFEALKVKRSPLLSEAMTQLEDDPSQVLLLKGCKGSLHPISKLVQQ